MIRRRILDLPIELHCGEPALEELFGRLLASFPPGEPKGPAPLRYELEKAAPGFLLRAAGHSQQRQRAEELFVALQDHIVDQLAAQKRYCLLHTAAVTRDEEVLLIPGPSQQGKSSLAAGMLHHGFSFLGDEVGALTDGGEALPCPFPLHLRESALPRGDGVPPALEAASDTFLKRHEPTYFAVPVPAAVAASVPLPVGAVVFPQLAAATGTRLAPLSKGLAAFKLIGTIFNGQAVGVRGIDAALAVVRNAPCYELLSDNVSEACDALEQVWAERQSAAPQTSP